MRIRASGPWARAALFVVCVASPSCSPGGDSSGAGGHAACPATPTACPEAPPRYAADVAPIIARDCSPCHFPGGREASRLFSTYADLFPQRGAMLTQLVACAMPPGDGPVMSSEDRAKVVAWLECGAKND